MGKFEINEIIDVESNHFDRQERIAWWDQARLKNARVMVVGAGAIGNEVLKNLALLGIGNIFIVDFDTISPSNLSRTVLFRKTDVGLKKSEVAAARVQELALVDDGKVDWFHGDLVWELGTGIYREMDIVLGCLDNIETRIAVNRNCWLMNTPWIDAGMKELGMRVEFYQPPQLPCYQCTLTNEQMENAGIRYSCDQFKKEAFDQGKMPTTQITSSIVAAIQVQEAIKYLSGQLVLTGKKIHYQGFNNDFDILTKRVNENCLAHVHYDEVVPLQLTNAITLKEFLEVISTPGYSGHGAALDFRGDRTFVESINCRFCAKTIKMMRPSFRIDVTETVCASCKSHNKSYALTNPQTETAKKTIEIFSLDNATSELLNMTLHELGVPFAHVVAVIDTKGQYRYYELEGDKPIILKQIHTSKTK
jgi:molybdopterin/thiamine biosynthesis adenylyltransferase